MENIFKDKKVVIIGSASHVTEINQRELIDSFDVVVRVNLSIPNKKNISENTGKRCDVWYVANKIINEQPKLLKLSYIKKIKTANYLEHLIPQGKYIELINQKYLKKVLKKLPTRGLRAIADIVKSEPKELYITGFTFYQTEKDHFYEDGKVIDPSHDFEDELKYFIKNVYNLPFVKTDEILTKIIEKWT